MEQLATFYSEGWGVEQDYQQAWLWAGLTSWRKQDGVDMLAAVETTKVPM